MKVLETQRNPKQEHQVRTIPNSQKIPIKTQMNSGEMIICFFAGRPPK